MTDNGHKSAVLSLANMPFGFTKASFPRSDVAPVLPAIGICSSTVTVTCNVPVLPAQRDRVTQVLLEGPTGEMQVVQEMTEDANGSYYLLVTPPEWNSAAAAGKTFKWHVNGLGSIPSFSASIIAPPPLTSLSPLPKGGGLVDFALSTPPSFSWNASSQGGTRIVMTFSGTNSDQQAGRVLTCYPADTGIFTPPASELLRFMPGNLSVGMSRVTYGSALGASFSGGVAVTAFSGLLLLDGQGAALGTTFTTR